MVLDAGRPARPGARRVVDVRLVNEQTGQPIEMGLTFAHVLANIVEDSSSATWPRHNAECQTFADKICSTVVLAH